MLFDPAPKEDPRDFFDRERELRELLDSIEAGERLIIVYGVRRVGKSSLVRVALRLCGKPFALVDVRELYFSEGVVKESSLVRAILRDVASRASLLERLGLAVREVAKGLRISLPLVEVDLSIARRLRFVDLLRQLSALCSKKGTRFVLVLDEAQYARFSNARYDGLIAWAVDNLDRVTIVLTGSEVGVLRDFLRLEDPEAPLFGRARREIGLERFSVEQSEEFLRRGMEEARVPASREEISEAVSVLDGVPGWLTLYGYYRAVQRLGHREALERVVEEGARLVLAELERVIAPSRARYAAILKAVALGASSWSSIKAFVVARAGPISDKRLSTLIKNLVRYGYLEKRGTRYEIPDPMVRYVARELL
ncbi:MAG: ATP-binding protein [Crenarchaeota archaeon]|nr:ATP-binding protein [Thermoproteota archaeon]